MTKPYNISVTPLAATKIKEKLEARKTPDAYLRLGVKGAGCAGYSYVIEYDDSVDFQDLLFESEGIKILVDHKSILYLNGTQLDWEKQLMYTGFKFINPLEQSRCGCGHSAVINKEQL